MVLDGSAIAAVSSDYQPRIFPFVAPNEEPKWAVIVLCGLCVGSIASWVCWRRTEAFQIHFSTTDTLFLIFFILLGIGVFIGPNIVEGVIRLNFWLVCAAVWLIAVWAMRHQKSWPDLLGWSISLGTSVFSLLFWWSYMLDYGKPGYNVSVLFSPIGHVNFTGDALIILLPFLIWQLATRIEPLLRVLNWFSVATVTTVLLVASSRGAVIGLAIGLMVLSPFLLKYGKRWLSLCRTKNIPLFPFIWVATALLAFMILYQLLPYHYRELARVSGTLQASFEVKALDKSSQQPPFATQWASLSPLLGARTPMYASATAMALDAPLLGQGTGNFAWVYPGYSNRFPDFRDSLSSERTFTTNPHNIVLQIATQNGIPATLIFLGLLGFFWYLLVRSLWNSWSGWHAAGLVAITAAVFDAMFNHIFFNPASMFVFALLGGSWWGSVQHDSRTVRTLLSMPWNKTAAIILLLVTFVLTIWPVRWIISEWHVGQAMVQARQPATASAHYDKAYAWNVYNFRAVFGKSQMAYHQKLYAESIKLLTHYEQIFPYNPPALNMLGAAYTMSGELPEAEAAFKRAIQTLPDFKLAKQNLFRVQSAIRRDQSEKQSIGR